MLLMKYQDEITERRSIFGVQRLFYTYCFVVCLFLVVNIKFTFSLIVQFNYVIYRC